jgi:hypothetical protein
LPNQAERKTSRNVKKHCFSALLRPGELQDFIGLFLKQTKLFQKSAAVSEKFAAQLASSIKPTESLALPPLN